MLFSDASRSRNVGREAVTYVSEEAAFSPDAVRAFSRRCLHRVRVEGQTYGEGEPNLGILYSFSPDPCSR